MGITHSLFPTALLAALLVAVGAIHAPALDFGWFGDDYQHRGFILDHLAGRPSAEPWWNMFDARGPSPGPLDPDPETLFGRLPWWASRDFSFALLRPLSTASHVLDYALWPDSPWAMHAHNVALFFAIVVVASLTYRRFFESVGFSALASVMLAIDDANTATVAWIAGRNTVLTTLLLLLTLWLHDRGSRGAPWSRYAAAFALLCAHASGEGAIATWGYLIAHAVCLDGRAPRVRLASLGPLAAVSAAWTVLSSSLGYGVRGSGAYVDPRFEPVEFAYAVVQRLPPLLETQLALPPGSAVALGVPEAFASVASRAYLALLLAGALLAARHSRVVAFFALATALSLVPQCAADSAGRLLMLSSFAAHGLTASVLGTLASALSDRVKHRALVLAPACAAVIAIHGWAALSLPRYGLAGVAFLHTHVLHAARSLPSGAELADKTIMILSYPDYIRSAFVSLYRRELCAPGPRRMHLLSATSAPIRVTRPAGDALQLTAEHGSLLGPTTAMVRRADRSFMPGESFELGEASVEVTSVLDDGSPSELRVRIAQARASSLLWVFWNEAAQRFERFALPALGQTISIGSAR